MAVFPKEVYRNLLKKVILNVYSFLYPIENGATGKEVLEHEKMAMDCYLVSSDFNICINKIMLNIVEAMEVL